MSCLGKSLNLVIFCLFFNSFAVSSQNDPLPNERCGEDFGACVPDKTSCKQCGQGFSGTIEAICKNGKWKVVQETCESLSIQQLLLDLSNQPVLSIFPVPALDMSMHINDYNELNSKPEGGCNNEDLFSCAARIVTAEQTTTGNILQIVELLNILLQNFPDDVTEGNMKDYGAIANHILNNSAIDRWTLINNSIGNSSALLQYVNEFASHIINSSVDVREDFIYMKSFKVTKQNRDGNINFSVRLNGTELTGSVLTEQEEFQTLPINSRAIAILYSTFGEILSSLLNRRLNGFVVSLVLNTNNSKLLLTFQKKIKSQANSKCVGWDMEQKEWMSDPCRMEQEYDETATCKCDHSKKFTSFSILMSTKTAESAALHIITFVGIGISICSLLVCLTIEGLLWHHVTKTEISYMRHLSIVNIAMSLLIADISFIVGASLYQKDTLEWGACIAATFFIHLFYLSLFFWMLIMALLISYRVLMVYHNMRKSSLILFAFAVGYGCPLVISIITLATTITQPNKPYLRDDGCWLNWNESKALLAFIIPALLIVALNFIIVLGVIFVLLRPSTGESPRTNERNIIVQIIRCIVILTPLLGLSWGFGLATIIDNSSQVVHYIFTILNAFQGFFILVCGTLMDKQVREALKAVFTSPKWISFLTRNTSNASD